MHHVLDVKWTIKDWRICVKWSVLRVGHESVGTLDVWYSERNDGAKLPPFFPIAGSHRFRIFLGMFVSAAEMEKLRLLEDSKLNGEVIALPNEPYNFDD